MGAPKINEKETIIKPDDGLYGAGRKGAELRASKSTRTGVRITTESNAGRDLFHRQHPARTTYGDTKPTFYFKAAPQFEAPSNSRYGWLNNALFVCEPEWRQDFNGIVLNVWRVK